MIKFLYIFHILLIATSGLFYIDRFTTKLTSGIDVIISFTHDSRGNAVNNVTWKTSVTIQKVLLYILMKTPEDENDREYKKTILQTVADVEKIYKSSQTNLIMKGLMADIIRSMDFDFKFPILPVKIQFGKFG